MKKLLLLFGLLSVMIVASAQEVKYTRDYYLAKSKDQKTAGWIMLGGGTALIIAGIAVGSRDNYSTDSYDLDFGPNFDSAVWLIGGGLVAGAASVPFFIGSANNARKAAMITITNEKVPVPNGAGFSVKTLPAVSLRVAL